jgi:hypothetical protein
VAAAGDGHDVTEDLRALCRDAQALLGHRLFTVMLHESALARNRRVFSSDPARWPVGGWKPVRDSAWSQRLFAEGLPFLCRTPSEIRATFPDHEAILALGLGSALNLPVRAAGRTLGALNLLHVEGHYTAADAQRGAALAMRALPVLGGLRDSTG